MAVSPHRIVTVLLILFVFRGRVFCAFLAMLELAL